MGSGILHMREVRNANDDIVQPRARTVMKKRRRKMTKTLYFTTAILLAAGSLSQTAAQEYPPYPPQKPISKARQGLIAAGKKNTPNGGRPEINTVEEMSQMSGYTAPGAKRYAALAAQAAAGQWGVTTYYRCKNTPGGTSINAPYPAPLEVFDGVYSIGQHANNIWAIRTSDGIILLDALNDEEEAKAFIVGNMMRLRLNPKDIKLILVSHGHSDHTGGVKYLKELTGARIGMAKADWDRAVADGSMPPKGENDFYLEDGEQITLGDRTLTAVSTPGHTPGTVSFLFPVTWKGKQHMASYFGGQGSPEKIPDLQQFRTSLDRMAAYNDLMQADVVLSNHTVGDDGLTKVADMAANPSKNPYIVGREAVVGYYEMWRACLSADIDQRVHDGERLDPAALVSR
jgi:metallo-beta-lactamase class B